MKKLILLTVCFFSFCLNAQQSGNLDTSFGINGKVTTNIGLNDAKSNVTSQAMQTDGKTILSGDLTVDGMSGKGLLVRINSDGSIDNTFNGNGFITSDLDTGFNVVKIQTDGKYVVGGNSSLSRYNVDGSLDYTFDSDGYVLQSAVDLEIQLDGKIIVLYGSTDGVGYPNCKLARYSSTGVLDSSFANNGIYTFGIGQSRPKSIQLQADQKILIGFNFSGSPSMWGGFKLFRLNNDGTVPETIAYSESYESPPSLITFSLQSDNKILISNSFGVYRYNSNLLLDNSFGVNGFISHITSGSDKAYAYKIKFLPNGKIIILNINYIDNTSNTTNVLLSRYNANGTFDTTFDGDGKLILPFLSSNDIAVGIDIFNTKIIVSANSRNGNENSVLLSKISFNGSMDNTFDNDGQKTVSFPSQSNDSSSKCLLQPDGKLIVGGSSSTSKISLVRYNTDGTIDTSFGNQGKYNFSLESYDFANKAFKDFGLLSDGKIIILIRSSFPAYGNDSSKIIRLNSNGSVDTGYGINGIYEIAIPDIINNYLFLETLKILPGDKIIIGGNYNNYYDIPNNQSNDKFLILIKLNFDTSFDTSFNNTGYSLLNYAYQKEQGITRLAIQTNGKIIAGGFLKEYYSDSGKNRATIFRLNEDGTKDLTFGNNGFYKIQVPWENWGNNVFSSDHQIASLDLQNDNKIITTSFYRSPYSPYFLKNNFSVTRINSDGTLDTSFGVAGTTQTTIENSCNSNALKVLPNQKILIAGYSTGVNNNFSLAKYNIDGSLDTSFGNQGTVITDFNNENDSAKTFVLTNDNKIIVTGSAINPIYGNSDFAVAKYDLENALEIQENENHNTVLFYPNPTNDKITFNPDVKSISIFSLDGKQISTEIKNNMVDLSHFSKGIYLIQIVFDNSKVITKKLIKY